MKNPWVIIGIITVVLFGGAILISNQSQEQANQDIEVKKHIKGNESASVKLVEFSDFQCPACQAFHPVVTEVINEFGDDLSFEYKHFPLVRAHPNAVSAAVAAEAAGQQDKFFEFHDLLFDNQSAWSATVSPNQLFIGYAEELGLDIDKFKRHMRSSVLEDKVKDDLNEGLERAVTGTPTFFLNGERMTYETYQEFRDKIADAIDPGSSSTTSPAGLPETEVKFGI